MSASDKQSPIVTIVLMVYGIVLVVFGWELYGGRPDNLPPEQRMSKGDSGVQLEAWSGLGRVPKVADFFRTTSTYPTPLPGTIGLFANNVNNDDNAELSIISDDSGSAILNFGYQTLEKSAYIAYDHSNSILQIGKGGAATPLLKLDFGNNLVTITGDLNVTNNIQKAGNDCCN